MTKQELQIALEIAKQELNQALEQGDTRRMYELNTALHLIKDCLIELL